MTINEYQQLALRTANPKLDQTQQLLNGVLGLNGEAGEFADLLKKKWFQGHDIDIMDVVKELGDIAWYLAISANAIGCDLETILQANVDKLKERYPDGFDSDHSKNRDPKDT